MHLASNGCSDRSITIQFFKGVILILLILIQVDVVSGSFDSLFLRELCVFEIVALYFFSLIVLIVKIIDAMTKEALLSSVQA